MAEKNPNFDNFFREKLSGYESPGKKGNWQLLNHLLDEKKRKRRVMWRILFVSLFLAVTFSAYLIFTPGENNKSIVENKNITPPGSSIPVTGSESNENKMEGFVNDSSNKKEHQSNAQNNMGEEKRDGVFAEKAEANKNTAKVEKGKAQLRASDRRNEKRSSGAQGNMDLSAAGVDSRKEDERAGEKDAEISEPSVNDKVGHKDSAIIDSHIDETSKAPMQYPVTRDTLATESVTKDSLAGSVEDSVRLKEGNRHFFSFNLYGGLNLYRTQSRSQADQRSVSPLVGLELVHPLSNRFAVGLGTMYSLQGGYNLADTATQVSYFLERNVLQEIILIRKQHKLYIPVTLYYMISDKHAVSCGIHWSYLINTVGDFTETNNTAQLQKDDVKGYMDGIESSSFSLSVGYRLSLSKRFDINARFIQELADSYTPEYFYGINTAPTWSLQTFLAIKF